jgi:cell division protein FtsW (lipid II flippase)
MAKKITFKQKIAELNPLAVFYYFCLTIVVVRGTIFLSLLYDHTPAVFVHGWHIHHFVFGFLFLVLALDESRKKNFSNWLLEIFYGIGLALVFDEFAYWTMNRFDYWSDQNYYAMLVLTLGVGVLTLIDQKVYQINIHRRHVKPKTFSFKRQFMWPWLSFLVLLFLLFAAK